MQHEPGTNERSFSFLGASLMPFPAVLWTGWSYFRHDPILAKKKIMIHMKTSKSVPVMWTLAWRWEKHWEFLPSFPQALLLRIVQCEQLLISMKEWLYINTGPTENVFILSIMLTLSEEWLRCTELWLTRVNWQWFAWGFAALCRGWCSRWQTGCLAVPWSWDRVASPFLAASFISRHLLLSTWGMQSPLVQISGFKWVSGAVSLGRWTKAFVITMKCYTNS